MCVSPAPSYHVLIDYTKKAYFIMCRMGFLHLASHCVLEVFVNAHIIIAASTFKFRCCALLGYIITIRFKNHLTISSILL